MKSMFDSYRLVRQLDKRGSSLLVRDEDTDLLVIRRRIAAESAETYERLRCVSHPCLQEVYFVREEAGALYAYCAWVEGESLEERLKKGITEKEAFSWIRDVLDALEVLHSADPPIVHRDLKPGNIVISPDGRAHIIDYGAARIYKDASASDTHMIGTRGYAAPEQYGFGQSDERTDVYACGILIDEMMTHAGSERKYARVVSRCTHIFPEKRYASAASVRRAMELRALPSGLRIAGRIAAAAAAICLSITMVRAFARDGKKADTESVVITAEPAPIVAQCTSDPALTEESNGQTLHQTGSAAEENADKGQEPADDSFGVYDLVRLSERIGTHATERALSWEEAVRENVLGDLSGNDPGTAYRIVVKTNTDSAEDVVIPPNVLLTIPSGKTLRFSGGGALSNYGEIWVSPNAELYMGEGSRFSCGGYLSDENGRIHIPGVFCYENAVLHFGKNVFITRDFAADPDARYANELVSLQDALLRFDDPESVRIDLGICNPFFLWLDDPDKLDEECISPFRSGTDERYEGIAVCFWPDPGDPLVRTIPFLTDETARHTFSTLNLTRIPAGMEIRCGPRTNMAVVRDLALEQGSVLDLASMLILHDGVTLTVKSGASLRYVPSFVSRGEGARILVEDGATVSMSASAVESLGDGIVFESAEGECCVGTIPA